MGEKQLHYAWILGSGYLVCFALGTVLEQWEGLPYLRRHASCASRGSASLCRQLSGGSCQQAECMCVILCMCFTRNTEVLSEQLSAWKPSWRNHAGCS